jgi:hypothetical protein
VWNLLVVCKKSVWLSDTAVTWKMVKIGDGMSRLEEGTLWTEIRVRTLFIAK